MANKNKVLNKIKELGLSLGCWDRRIGELTITNLTKVIDNIEYANDTDIFIKRRPHVVEIDIVEGEVDLNVLSKAEYIDRYGDERYDD